MASDQHAVYDFRPISGKVIRTAREDCVPPKVIGSLDLLFHPVERSHGPRNQLRYFFFEALERSGGNVVGMNGENSQLGDGFPFPNPGRVIRR